MSSMERKGCILHSAPEYSIQLFLSMHYYVRTQMYIQCDSMSLEHVLAYNMDVGPLWYVCLHSNCHSCFLFTAVGCRAGEQSAAWEGEYWRYPWGTESEAGGETEGEEKEREYLESKGHEATGPGRGHLCIALAVTQCISNHVTIHSLASSIITITCYGLMLLFFFQCPHQGGFHIMMPLLYDMIMINKLHHVMRRCTWAMYTTGSTGEQGKLFNYCYI